MPEPSKLQAGTSATWTQSVSSDRSSTAGYAAEYRLIGPSDSIDIPAAQAVLVGTTVTVTLTPTITAAYPPGKYSWWLYAVKSGEKWPIRSGYIEITPDPTSEGYDTRSHARICLDAIEALLQDKALSGDMSSLSIQTGQGSRSITALTYEELLSARSRYQREVANEEAAEALANGESSGKTIRVRFT